MNRFWKQLIWETEAATAVEYAVMLGLILVGIIAAIGTVGGGTSNMWSNNSSQLENAMNP